MKRLALIVAMTCAPAIARAQFVTSGANLDKASQQDVDETTYTGRVFISGMYYAESASATPAGSQDAAPGKLLYTDIRGFLKADHIQGGKWQGVGDLRLRVASNGAQEFPMMQTGMAAGSTARGWLGGNEYQLREGYVLRRGDKVDLALGRQVLLDVDAIRIDGLRAVYRKSDAWELGAFAGLYPNPFSRTIDDDYKPADANKRTITEMPVAGGAWAGYRYNRVYGALGLAAVDYRDKPDPAIPADPLRTFVSSQGYFRVKTGVDVFHYGVLDLTGPAKQQLMNLQVGLHWRAKPRVLIEAGVSRMSTYAIAIYVRDILQPIGATPPPAGSIVNNLVLARMGADEARVGATYNMIEKRVDVWGTLRYRKRDALDNANLPAVIAALPPESMYDVSAGIRQKKSLGGWTLSATGDLISGLHTDTYWITAGGQRTFLKDKLDVELDVMYVSYKDVCPAAATDPTCGGNIQGTTIRPGGSIVYLRDKHWVIIGDYRLTLNSAKAVNAGVSSPRPDITGHSLFVRAQYSF